MHQASEPLTLVFIDFALLICHHQQSIVQAGDLQQIRGGHL